MLGMNIYKLVAQIFKQINRYWSIINESTGFPCRIYFSSQR